MLKLSHFYKSLKIISHLPSKAKLAVKGKGPSINYVVSRVEGGQKLPILPSKKTTKRGVKNLRFWDDIVYGRPPTRILGILKISPFLIYNLFTLQT